MERYQLTKEELSTIEKLQQPFAIYQYVDKRVVTLALSRGFCDLFGYTDMEKAYFDMDNDMYKDTHPDDVAWISDEAVRFATEDGKYEVIYRTKAHNAEGYRVIHARGEHVYTDTGVRLAHVWYMDEGSYEDEANAKGVAVEMALANSLREESIRKSNHYDQLTGLPNLTYFFELAEAAKNAICEKKEVAALLYIDLNGMKYFNQKNGFAEGDSLLRAIAKILAKNFGNENCCHVGADRFAAYAKAEGLEDALNRVFAEAAQCNNGRTLPVRVGIYLSDIEDVPPSTAYDRAKVACDANRSSGGSCFNYYSREMSEKEIRRRYIQSNIDRAIKEHWIKVYYQPIVRAVTEKVCDEEALARWIDPEKGFLSPGEFIPYLEDSGQIWKLDLYMLEQSLEKMKKIEDDGYTAVPHSVNLSRSDFEACDIVEEIRKRVDAAGISRDMITIEITESIIGSNFEFMKEQIKRFRDLGFPVWMDDFGSGYSSLNVLQSIPFDLIKFDMSFMRRLDEGESGKIILTELMKMATSLGVDTVCEGVETEEQVRFLQEIGCSKLQGFYFCKPIPYEDILERYKKGIQIGFEDQAAASYYESVGRVNLYDLGVIASEDENNFHNTFNTLPMGIIEVKGEYSRFVRSNPSYRAFIDRFFGDYVKVIGHEYRKYGASFMRNVVKTCCEQGIRSFYDEKMDDGSVVHSFARRIGTNPITGSTAVAIAVLSITDPKEEASYADIARALAADYYNIYVVDLDTDRFIEYNSTVGGDELAMERHGNDFFESAKRDTMTRIYEEDRELFLTFFSKENIIKELDEQGVFTTTYRLVDSGKPVYANMKITRLEGSNRIILGISIIDSQMKEREQLEKAKRERATLARIMAIIDDYLSVYAINPDTGHYYQYTASDSYESFGFASEGDDFFHRGQEDGKKVVYQEDLPMYLDRLDKDIILKEIEEHGEFKMHYRLVMKEGPHPVTFRVVPFRDGDRELLLASVRAWRKRK